MKREDYLSKYKRCLYEYIDTSASGAIDEADPAAAPAGDTAAMGADPAAMGAAPAADPTAMGAAPAADPAAMGAAPAADPTAMGAATAADPAAMGAAPAADPAAMGAAPAADPAAAQQGITPQADPQGGVDSEDIEQVADNSEELADNSEELSDASKATEAELEAMTSKFDNLMEKLRDLEDAVSKNSEMLTSFKDDMEKRNPTPEEKLSLRSRNYSAPFSKPTDEYWDEKEATSNYSTEDDKNGEDMPEYHITKSDVDNINDWHNISKSFDSERMGLRDILGY